MKVNIFLTFLAASMFCEASTAKDEKDSTDGYNFCIINRLKPGFPSVNQTYSTIHVGSINSNWGTVKIDRHHKHRIPKWAFPIRVCNQSPVKDISNTGKATKRGYCFDNYLTIYEPGCYKIHTGTSRKIVNNGDGAGYIEGSMTYKKLTGKDAHKRCTCK